MHALTTSLPGSTFNGGAVPIVWIVGVALIGAGILLGGLNVF